MAIFAAWISIFPAHALVIEERFDTDPLARGWKIHGNTNLFAWDNAGKRLLVTWDSSQTNSYFHLPLGTVLHRADDFAVAFDLGFSDYVIGTNPAKPWTFQAAVGFLNLIQATHTNFSRGVGTSVTYGPRNLVEFNFFPEFDMFSATIAQAVLSTNNAWLYNHDNLLDMTPGQTFRVTMNYAAASRTLITTVTNNGARYGPVQSILVPTNFDFRVSSFSVSSYSDLRADGSLLAHGFLDNITLVVPAPPVSMFAGQLTGGQWRAQFKSRTNWTYSLERSVDLSAWTNASASASGKDSDLSLWDTNPPASGAHYRVKALLP
jgi:hypothetical protein